MNDSAPPEVVYVIHPIAEPFLEPLNFFRRFDHSFFLNKVRALLLALSEAGMASLAATDPDGAQTPEARKALEDGLRSEIHFTLIHNIETLVCLMMAGFHRNAPPSIFMVEAKYANDYIDALQNGNFRKLSRDVAADERSFYIAALFAGQVPVNHPQWEQLFQDTVNLLKHCYRIRGLAHDAYNAYKHGLRMTFGATALELAPNDGSVDPEYVALVDSADSSQYMVRSRTETKDAVVAPGAPILKPYDLQTHFYDPRLSANIVTLLRHVMGNLKQAYLSSLTGQSTMRLTQLNHELVEQVIAQGNLCGTMGFKAGDQFVSDLRRGNVASVDPQS